MNTEQFRTDINGLRAYAVILVVLFHFKVLGFSAGFLGVDIFFVISGYLMSKIIIEKMINKKFSFSDFYLARATRIVPALLFLVLVLSVLGWFIFIPEDFKNFAKDAKYSLMFLSNDLYYRQAGDYFAVNAHDKVLLHTWSLSVEWQFYIIFPILIFLYFKTIQNSKHLGLFLLLLFTISLCLCIYISPKDSIFAFFKLPTRAWELIAGGLTYYYFRQYNPSSKIKIGIEVFGFMLILISLIVFNNKTLWPSFYALLPVIGTICILIANHQKSIFTQAKIIQHIGSASYSIYLWHWPIAFLLGYYLIEQNTITVGLAIGLSLILGWLSYKYIETTRSLIVRLKPRYGYILLLGSIGLLYPVYGYIAQDGVKSRASQFYLTHSEKIEMPKTSNGWCFYNVKDDPSLVVGSKGLQCHIASKQVNAKSALLFGDSFAGHNIPFWHNLGQKLNLNINAITTNWCYPSVNKDFTGDKNSTAYQQCLINRNYLKTHLDQYDVFIFAGRWSDVVKQNQQNNFEELLQLVEQQHKKVIVMAEPYAFDNNISLLYKRAMWLNQGFNLDRYLNNPKAVEQKVANKIITDMTKRHSNILLLTQTDLFKPDQMATKDTPYSLDGRHLSIFGSLASEQYFIKQDKYKVLQNFIYKP